MSLRPISREDYATLFQWRSSFETIHVLNFRRRIPTFEEFVRDLEQLIPNSMILLIRRAKDGQPIGYAIAYNLNPWDGWLTVGLYLDSRFQQRPHGGEAALIFVDFLFRFYPLRKMVAEVYEFADKTLKLVQAMGAEQVGFMPDHYWHEDRMWGLHHMVLTRARWEVYRQRFVDIIDVARKYERMVAPSENGRGEPSELTVTG